MPNYSGKKENAQKFDLIAGNLCLDFINTLDNRPTQPKELLNDYNDLARFAEKAGILTPAQRNYFSKNVPLRTAEAERALRRARSLRESLHAIFAALMNHQKVPQPAMDQLNAALHDAALHSRLVESNQVGRDKRQHNKILEWRFDDLTSSFTALLWPIARSAADLLASGQLSLVRACSSPTCRWLFLDTSKNHHRRWCSMKLCGNRIKVRKFYARKKEDAAERR
jgi:predicted RNA-binding Zn ribbon-like protein